MWESLQRTMFRTFLTSYFWPTWHPKGPGHRAEAIGRGCAESGPAGAYAGMDREFSEGLGQDWRFNDDLEKCRIRGTALLRVLWPSSHHTKMGVHPTAKRKGGWSGGLTGGDAISGRCKGFARQTALLTAGLDAVGARKKCRRRCFDGASAVKCRQMTKYDPNGRFRMSVRQKNCTFYDMSMARNKRNGEVAGTI